jgi:hypothetical protein
VISLRPYDTRALTTAERRSQERRLTTAEINVLVHLLKCGAAHTPIRLPAAGHKAAVELWKQHLVHIWYRQSLALRRQDGPFYALTTDGTSRAESLYLHRREREQLANELQADDLTPPPREIT